MTNFNKFVARQLTKKQMNEVKGGQVALACTVRTQDGKLVAIQHVEYGETYDEALDKMLTSLGDNNGFNCKSWVA